MVSRLDLLKTLVIKLKQDESKIKNKIELYESEIKNLEKSEV